MSFYIGPEEADEAFRADPLKALNDQRQLFQKQVDKLGELVLTQASITGMNPLAHEMAAGALSIDIGKKPKDILTPKAVKYMLDVFSIKDTLGKRETREISAACNLTVTQVKDFFASQRSFVRKTIRSAIQKCSRSKALNDGTYNVSSPDQPVPLSILPPAGFSDLPGSEGLAGVPETSVVPYGAPCLPVIIDLTDDGETNNCVHNAQQIISVTDVTTNCGTSSHHTIDATTWKTDSRSLLTSECTDEKKAKGGNSSQQTTATISADVKVQEAVSKEVVPPRDVDSEDKKFLDNIFVLMGKTNDFTEQEELLEWILQIKNTTILNWFLTMGGLKILSAWLHEAADDEQTSYLRILFKVLNHLPLRRALPADLSAILKTLNKLRFFRTSDIQEKARVLLSRLSKQLLRYQPAKKSQSSLSYGKKITERSEILHDESWQSQLGIPEDILALSESANDLRETGPSKVPRLLAGPSDDASKKSIAPQKPRLRRKVQFVEHPDHKSLSKGSVVARAAAVNHSRPISADDIHKAKKQAIFMQNKYGKVDAKSEDKTQTVELQPHSMLSESQEHQPPKEGLLDQNAPAASLSSVSCRKEISTSRETLIETLKRVQIPWRIPPVVRLNLSVAIAGGEDSKEFHIQVQRNGRDVEAVYARVEDIPPNPKDPWDPEMDFDDSLTPELPVDGLEDTATPATSEAPTVIAEDAVPVEEKPAGDAVPQPASGSASGTAGTAPDFELLAVLLKNPELVFALTSTVGQSMPTEQQVALLNALKMSGVSLADLVNAVGSNAPEHAVAPLPVPAPVQDAVPASLPSPTPPSDPAARASWRSEFSTPMRTPLLQQHIPVSRAAASLVNNMPQNIPAAMAAQSAMAPAYVPQAASVQQMPVPALTVSQQALNISPAAHQAVTLDGRISIQQSSAHSVVVPHQAISNAATVFPLSHQLDSLSYPQRYLFSQTVPAPLPAAMATLKPLLEPNSYTSTIHHSPSWMVNSSTYASVGVLGTSQSNTPAAGVQLSTSYKPYTATTTNQQPVQQSLSGQPQAAHYSLSANSAYQSTHSDRTLENLVRNADHSVLRSSEFRSRWDGDGGSGRSSDRYASGSAHDGRNRERDWDRERERDRGRNRDRDRRR